MYSKVTSYKYGRHSKYLSLTRLGVPQVEVVLGPLPLLHGVNLPGRQRGSHRRKRHERRPLNGSLLVKFGGFGI